MSEEERALKLLKECVNNCRPYIPLDLLDEIQALLSKPKNRPSQVVHHVKNCIKGCPACSMIAQSRQFSD